MVNNMNKEVVSFDTGRLDGTVAIGLSFIFIAYFLHPAVESAYHRVRAYRAWRAVEKRQAVDVTNYPLLEEIFRGRRKWDTARIMTVLVVMFTMASCGLELSMGLAYHSGDADTLDRPPPIYCGETSDGTITWKVMPQEDFDFQRDRNSLLKVSEHSAMSIYKMIKAETCRPGYVDGNIVAAFWSDNTELAHTQLHYLRGGSSTITVKNLQCEADTQPKSMNIMSNESVPWGTGVECKSGPSLKAYDGKNTPATLILNKTNHEVYLIVEESSNSPNFLYSVWTTKSTDADSVEINHEFHIASTVRLVEAVITGIVHGNTSGKYCFQLVRIYSENGDLSDSDVKRAAPFGEHPTADSVRIENLETIQCGLAVDQKTGILLACVLVLTSVGIAWSLCLRSSIGMDVYDRDEIIRAVSLSGAASPRSCNNPSTIRIFACKDDTGNMRVVINETDDSESGCARKLQLGKKVVEDNNPTPLSATNTIYQYIQGYGCACDPGGTTYGVSRGSANRPGRSLSRPEQKLHLPENSRTERVPRSSKRMCFGCKSAS